MTQAIIGTGSSSHKICHDEARQPDGNTLQLLLGLGTMSVCFAVAGSLGGMMPIVSERLNLNEAQVGLALAMPVVLASICRIFLGVLTDRFGGRTVCLAVLAFALLPLFAIGFAKTYPQLLACAFLLGVPMGIFPVGVVFVSDWYPPRRHGVALGAIGLANIGHSLALLAAPLVVVQLGYRWGFWIFGLLLLGWLVVFNLLARDGKIRRPSQLREFVRPFGYRMSWILSLFYFATFGGFLVMSSYLPRFFTMIAHMPKAEAGLRAAIFVLFTGAIRPIGGLLADRVGGKPMLLIAFGALAAVGVCMASPEPSVFMTGAVGMGVALGLGNGAVFKLVPQHFPKSIGTVTGVVGAIGALGGFFPSVALGLFQQFTGAFTGAFILLSVFATVCFSICALAVPSSVPEAT